MVSVATIHAFAALGRGRRTCARQDMRFGSSELVSIPQAASLNFFWTWTAMRRRSGDFSLPAPSSQSFAERLTPSRIVTTSSEDPTPPRSGSRIRLSLSPTWLHLPSSISRRRAATNGVTTTNSSGTSRPRSLRRMTSNRTQFLMVSSTIANRSSDTSRTRPPSTSYLPSRNAIRSTRLNCSRRSFLLSRPANSRKRWEQASRRYQRSPATC